MKKVIVFLVASILTFEAHCQEDLLIEFSKSQKKILLLGEQHRLDGSVSYLKNSYSLLPKYNIKNVLIEFPASTQKSINHYFRTGDSTQLYGILETFNCSDSNCENGSYIYYNFFRPIHLLNSNLSSKQRINVYAIDGDYSKNFLVSLYCIKYLFNKDEYRIYIDEIDDLIINEKLTFKESYDYIKQLTTDSIIMKDEKLYSQISEVFYSIIFEEGVWSMAQKRRDSLMAENLYKLYNNHPNEKFFGQFGMGHIKYIKGYNNFVSIMRDDRHYKRLGKEVINCSYMYCNINASSKIKKSRELQKITDKEIYDYCEYIKEQTLYSSKKDLKKKGLKMQNWDGIIYIKEANEIVTCPID